MYRAGGPIAAALPWSRRSIRPWTTALTVVAAFALALPQSMIVSLTGSVVPPGLGFAHLLLVAESVAVPLVLVSAGAMLMRGRRILLGPLLAFALFPFGTALVMALRPISSLARQDPRTTLGAVEVFGAAELTILYGASASAAACIVLASAMGGTVATVDRDRIDVLPRSPWTVLSAGSAWFVFAFIVRATNAAAFGSSAFLALSLIAPLAATALAALVVWCSGIFARTDDAKERRAAFAFVVVASLASGAGVLLLDRAASAAATFQTLRAIDAGTADAYTSLLELAGGRSIQTFALAVDIGGCATVFGIALRCCWSTVPAADRRRDMLRSRGIYVAGATALLAWLLVVIVSLMSAAARGWCARVMEEAWGAPGDLELPSVRADVPRHSAPRGQSLTLHVDGVVGKLDTSGNAPLTNLYADRRATFSVFLDAVRAGRVPTRVNLVGRRDRPREGTGGRDALGDLAAFLPPPEHVTPAFLRFGASMPGWIVVVLDEAPAARLQWQGRERIVSLGGDEDAAARSAAFLEVLGPAHEHPPTPPGIRVLPRNTDSMDRVVAVLQALESLSREVELGFEPPTSSGRGSAGSASSPRRR